MDQHALVMRRGAALDRIRAALGLGSATRLHKDPGIDSMLQLEVVADWLETEHPDDADEGVAIGGFVENVSESSPVGQETVEVTELVVEADLDVEVEEETTEKPEDNAPGADGNVVLPSASFVDDDKAGDPQEVAGGDIPVADSGVPLLPSVVPKVKAPKKG